MPTSAQFRAMARRSLAGNWKSAVLHCLLFFVVALAIGAISGFLAETYSPVFGQIVNVLTLGALSYGVYAFYLLFSRGGIPTTATLFSGFSRYVDTFLLYLLVMIFTFLWTLLFIIPGIIASFRYSQAFYILRDNPGISPLEAIRRSKAMMIGHKGRLFLLCLTFIGWSLLCVVTLGIGALWVTPYYYTTLAHFYNDLLSRSVSSDSSTLPNSHDGVTV